MAEMNNFNKYLNLLAGKENGEEVTVSVPMNHMEAYLNYISGKGAYKSAEELPKPCNALEEYLHGKCAGAEAPAGDTTGGEDAKEPENGNSGGANAEDEGEKIEDLDRSVGDEF